LQEAYPEATIDLIRDPDPEARIAALADAEVLYAVRFSKNDLTAAKRLKWLHLTSAGATHVLFPEMIESDILVTNSRGLYGVPIAEHVLGVMLMFTRRFHEAYPLQREGRWARPEMLGRFPLIAELHGRTVGIIGLGSIGLAVAERCQALGMRVIANKRRGGAKPVCVDQLFGPGDLPELLAQSDYVVIAAPLTPETKGMIGEKEIHQMKPTAFLLNVGRGPIIREADLIQALKEDRLGGAGLDVTDPEPPAADSELFHLPNVILTPHYSGLRSNYWEHSVALFQPILGQYLRGEPMDNLVDKRGGY
ncbi:MAG: D-2-hydroxyacid dehydrogenase, partial [Myxococcales bacterium]|nr:D-2-hydroxyacid dehydrogenase [Myxococcales bacterium]